ncbi:MAG: hypothetical protein VB095_03810, partial [Anaerovorax sp.]|nr:hypothetical protein [Anaerovorax sp.]
HGPEPCASANSAMPAYCSENYISTKGKENQVNNKKTIRSANKKKGFILFFSAAKIYRSSR